MSAILTAVIPVVIIGIICAAMLVIASKLMAVKEDERLPKVRECLPGANCGACGYAGCDGYAKALVEDEGVPTNLCVPGADGVAKQLSEVLGVEFEDVVEQVAVIQCSGDCDHTEDIVDHINQRLCIGCGLCAKTCPNSLISIIPDVERVVIACSNRDKGAATRKACSSGCIGCRKCVKVCPNGAISIVDNLAVIDYSKCENCPDFGVCARECTVKCIQLKDLSGIHRF